MARRRFEEEDEEHAATVLMKDVLAALGEDALTPRAAPRREVESLGRLVIPEPEIPPAPLAAPRPPAVVASLPGPPPFAPSLRGRPPLARPPRIPTRRVRPALRAPVDLAWVVAGAATALVVVGAWALL